MKLFDSHCHFEKADPIVPALARAAEAGVEAILAVGGSADLNASAVRAVKAAAKDAKLPRVYLAAGLDRDQATAGLDPKAVVDAVVRELDAPGELIAVGEIGLDYHYDAATRAEQLKLFESELHLAHELEKPVVIHTREAAEDTIAILKGTPACGVIHSFTGEADEAKAYLDLGFYISISGIVTFNRAQNVREMARTIPLDRLLIETDAPYLAPVPMRGRPNESAFVAHTCRFLAELFGVDAEAFAARTFANAEAALKLNSSETDYP